ncbi:hypothetical protein OPKNFCMD_3199 [Methylobacterium crusticola]|uniref:Glycosyltransferase 61 catalytic domain-containing protein n=1 Tax=Methylobacterium crusticola TaxID=1697972 RepID=A0ABQ4QYG7_9HYPH|nr:glycosyltransferase family 61 protein [Methylobacterium crusticola]GJD50460.1 hypothetical protein OPKNFCMD_3199 [Methylobacterium crusticola]
MSRGQDGPTNPGEGAPAHPLPRLACARHRDVVVHALLPGSAKARLILPDTPGDRLITHLRSRKGALYDVVEHVPAAPGAAPEAVPGPVIYGGPLFEHYGHAVAESIHRLWPRLAGPDLARVPVAFHPTPRRGGFLTVPAMPGWMRQIFDYLGLPPGEIVLIDRPLRFDLLLVPDQAKGQTFAARDPGYVDLFPRPLGAAAGPASGGDRLDVYVSRRHYHHAGSYLGEALVEEILARAGFVIVHPEAEPLSEVIALFRRADALVFSEGSALHTLELCGRIQAPVLVVARRSVAFCETVFGPILAAAAPRHSVFPAREPVTPLDWDIRKEGPKWGNASARVDLRGLLAAIAAMTGAVLDPPAPEAVATAERLDLLRIILDPRSTGPTTDDLHLGRLLRRLRAQAAESGLA